jgi:hypothetical protein
LAEATEGDDTRKFGEFDREVKQDVYDALGRGVDEKLEEQKAGLMPFNNRFLTRRGTSLGGEHEHEPYADSRR